LSLTPDLKISLTSGIHSILANSDFLTFNMTVELIDLPNPPPMASRLPSETLKLAKDLVKQPLDDNTAGSLKAFRNAADYIAAGKPAPQLRSLCFVDLFYSYDIPERQRASQTQISPR
jgi:hypothetical protein